METFIYLLLLTGYYKSLIGFSLKQEYSKVKELGDKLLDVDSLIDWEPFRSIVAGMFDNKSENGGRPNTDEIVMVKLLLLQEWYGVSDYELEKQAKYRLSFKNFLCQRN